MISFHYEFDFTLDNESDFRSWIERVVVSEGYIVGDLQYIFCDDDYLLKIHRKYLNKDSFTDIISFDYTASKVVSGDIFISVTRVRENADKYKVSYEDELLRVMAHGPLHFMSYDDKNEEDRLVMKKKEEEKIKLFHVEQ